MLLLFEDHKESLIKLVDYIQSSFSNVPGPDKKSKVFSAIEAAQLLLKVNGGKVVVFNASTSITSDPLMRSGSHSNVTKEELPYTCTDNQALFTIGLSLVNDLISCDIFQAAKDPCNLVTLNQICNPSNGHIYLYKNFDLTFHYKNFYNQVRRVVSRQTGWEAVCKIKISKNFQVKEVLTPVLTNDKILIVLPTVDW